jgi:adenine-specific DNA-methyltransferase
VKDPKSTGSYYTPEFLSKFVLSHVADHFIGRKHLSVLEPSVGDGSFVRAFNETSFGSTVERFSFTGIDKILPELRKAKRQANVNRKDRAVYTFVRADFLKFQKGTRRKFSLITGNPPYMKRGRLNGIQKELCEEIHRSAGLAPLTVKNIWPSFLVRSTQLLEDAGVLAFVLPAEILQVKFAAELRTFLTTHFARVEVFTFDDLLFECKGQDTVLLLGYKKSAEPGQFFAHIVDKAQLERKEFRLDKNATLTSTDTKWSHHHLDSDDLDFVYKLTKPLKLIGDYCESKPGVVTAANSYFIVDLEIEKKYGLRPYTVPIIQKGIFVNGSVVFNKKDYTKLVESGKPSRLIRITDRRIPSLPSSVKDYLKEGVKLELPTRHKCTERENWFVIPNISTVPDGFFFKRSHHYPKLLKNNADVFVTDSAYKIEMKETYAINHLIYSFYNSLTLIFAELEGRYYGGGVLELTPLEFKKLPLPMTAIANRGFNLFTRAFENKLEISVILEQSDPTVLHEALGLNQDEIRKIKSIYDKLIAKRFRIK